MLNWKKFVKAGAAMAATGTLTIFVLFWIWLLERVHGFFWDGEKAFYGTIDIDWFFDTFDLITLIMFLFYGLISTFKVLMSDDDES